MKATFILSLVMAILIAIFALLNGTTVPVSFGFAQIEASLALIILVSVAIGAIIIYLIDVMGKFKSARRIKDLEKKISKLEKEVSEKAAVISKLSQAEAISNAAKAETHQSTQEKTEEKA